MAHYHAAKPKMKQRVSVNEVPL